MGIGSAGLDVRFAAGLLELEFCWSVLLRD
jgi:hypothetical protein